MARQMTFQKYYVACAFAIWGSMSLYWSLLPGVAEITWTSPQFDRTPGATVRA